MAKGLRKHKAGEIRLGAREIKPFQNRLWYPQEEEERFATFSVRAFLRMKIPIERKKKRRKEKRRNFGEKKTIKLTCLRATVLLVPWIQIIFRWSLRERDFLDFLIQVQTGRLETSSPWDQIKPNKQKGTDLFSSPAVKYPDAFLCGWDPVWLDTD